MMISSSGFKAAVAACSMFLLCLSVQGAPLKRRLSTNGDDSTSSTTATTTSDAEWTYRDTGTRGVEPLGPSDWYLSYPDCAGQNQSPIDLSASYETVAEHHQHRLSIPDNSECISSDLGFIAGRSVWEIDFEHCEVQPYLDYKGEIYSLVQIHIHSPSEHQMGGAEKEAGIHMVHQKEGGDYLVVAVMFEITEFGHNVELQKLWDVLEIGEASTSETFTTTDDFNISVYELLPAVPDYVSYKGSLTTPPCSEGVQWIVMTEPSDLSRKQLEDYRDAVAAHDGSRVDGFGNTNRPIQEINDRTVHYVYVESDD